MLGEDDIPPPGCAPIRPSKSGPAGVDRRCHGPASVSRDPYRATCAPPDPQDMLAGGRPAYLIDEIVAKECPGLTGV